MATLLIESQKGESDRREVLGGWTPTTEALITLFQYDEKLSDRQAEEASRLRIDWKYALHLPMHHQGFSHAQLCVYRQQTLQDPVQQADLELLRERFTEWGFYKDGPGPLITALDVLVQVCSLSRLEEVLNSMRRALEALSIHHTEWLRDIILPPWYIRYHLFKTPPDFPINIDQREALVQTIGADIHYLFNAISRHGWSKFDSLEELQALQKTWLEQFEQTADGDPRYLAQCTFCGHERRDRTGKPHE
jgi:transposase